MRKDKACISAVKEVCQRCHLYKENCGMLDYPDQCSKSGRYIDGYRQAEKDLELGWKDMSSLKVLLDEVENEFKKGQHEDKDYIEYCKEVLKRFKAQKGE